MTSWRPVKMAQKGRRHCEACLAHARALVDDECGDFQHDLLICGHGYRIVFRSFSFSAVFTGGSPASGAPWISRIETSWSWTARPPTDGCGGHPARRKTAFNVLSGGRLWPHVLCSTTRHRQHKAPAPWPDGRHLSSIPPPEDCFQCALWWSALAACAMYNDAPPSAQGSSPLARWAPPLIDSPTLNSGHDCTVPTAGHNWIHPNSQVPVSWWIPGVMTAT